MPELVDRDLEEKLNRFISLLDKESFDIPVRDGLKRYAETRNIFNLLISCEFSSYYLVESKLKLDRDKLINLTKCFIRKYFLPFLTKLSEVLNELDKLYDEYSKECEDIKLVLPIYGTDLVFETLTENSDIFMQALVEVLKEDNYEIINIDKNYLENELPQYLDIAIGNHIFSFSFNEAGQLRIWIKKR